MWRVGPTSITRSFGMCQKRSPLKRWIMLSGMNCWYCCQLACVILVPIGIPFSNPLSACQGAGCACTGEGIAPSSSTTLNNPAMADKRRAMALTPSPYNRLSSREFNEDFKSLFQFTQSTEQCRYQIRPANLPVSVPKKTVQHFSFEALAQH